MKSTTYCGLHVTPESFGSIQNPLDDQVPSAIAVLRYRSRFVVGEAGLIFRVTFITFPTSLVKFPRGSPHRCSKALRHCFRSLCAGVARPHPWSGCNPCFSERNSTPRRWCRVPGQTSERLSDFPRLLDFRRRLSTSRFLRACQVSSLFGGVIHRVLRSAHHPCRLRATAHPDCLPSCQESHPTRSSSGLSSCEVGLTDLSSLATRLNGLCSHELPDCDGPGYDFCGAVTPRPAQVCKLPLCLRFTGRRVQSLLGASWPLLSTCVVGGCVR